MDKPALKVLVDWNDDDDFGDAFEDLEGRVLGISWTRGRSADFSAEATGSATITLRNDDDLYTPTGASGPTQAQLVPGRRVRVYATYLFVTYPLFYGFIERISYDPRERTATITAYDPLKRLSETDVVVAANSFVQRSARDFRVAILDEFARGTRNLVSNPEFATNTAGWDTTTYAGAVLTRITTDAPPPSTSATCATYVTGTVNQRMIAPLYLAPVFFAGVVYRASAYVRAASPIDVEMALLTDVVVGFTAKTVSVGTAWQRITVTYTLPSTITATEGTTPFRLSFRTPTTPGTFYVGAVSVTRGQSLYPYETAGTGRWPNWCGNGSFDGQALNGWYDAWTNLVGNPSFETDTIGWSVAGDAFVTASSSITRVAAVPKYGVARADWVSTASGQGLFYALTGTFKAGITYAVSIWAYNNASGQFRIGIGSNGTPADKAQSTAVGLPTSYQQATVTWTPSADRTDVHLYVQTTSSGTLTFGLDGAYVFRRDLASANDPAYADTGPGGGGSFVTTRALSTTAKYGSRSHSIVTPATATAGRVYDFSHIGPYFVSGQPYTASVWLRPSSSMPYKVGLAANKGDGTFDEASTIGTAPADTWTQVTLTWTPSADRSSATAFNTVVYVYQTDATARTVLIDGVRVIPGSSADAFEMAHWSLGAEPDVYLPAASISGSALSGLSTLNGLTLSRHWIEPTSASPWYVYTTAGRDDVKASVETYDDDLADMNVADIDRASIVNIVPVSHANGTEYYSDAASVSAYGPRPTGNIGNSAFLPDVTIPDAIGAALLARYKDPRARPEITVENRWPSQLQRELDDLVTVNFARLGISAGRYLILRLTTTVSESGQRWVTVYALEEAA